MSLRYARCWARTPSVRFSGKVGLRVLELMAPLAEFLRVHAGWIGPVMALLCLMITLAGVGLLMPAAAIMLIVGSLAGAGAVDGVHAFFGALVGTIAGTSLSYSIGRRFGPSFARWRRIGRHRRQIARARLFFRRRGTLALVLSRFLGPLRSVAPFVAGTMRMPRTRFEALNALSAVLWVAVMLLPGWLTLRARTPLVPPAGEIGAPPQAGEAP